MIIEKALGKLGDAAFLGRAIDVLDIEWFNAAKRVDRKTTRSGRDVGIRMDHTVLTQDQVVFDDGNELIAVNILPCECIRVKTRSVSEIVGFCYRVGNHHAPLFYGGGENEFLTPYDKPLMAILLELGFDAQQIEDRLLPEKSI